eukprot:gene10288-18986_t
MARSKMLNVLEGLVDEDEMRMIKKHLSETRLKIKVGEEQHWFHTNTSTPQGVALSPTLFTVYLEAALAELKKDVPNFFEEVVEMCYSDDTNFFSQNAEAIEKIEADAGQVLGSFDLVVNQQKTEKHKLTKRKNDNIKILGSYTDLKREMKERKNMAQAAFTQHHHTLTNEKLAARTRVRAFNVYVKLVLLYNCQTWDLGEADKDSLDAFHRRLLRRVMRVFYPSKISNDELYRRTGAEKASNEVARRRWAFIGHTLRHQGPAREAMEKLEEKRCTMEDADDRARWKAAKEEVPRRSGRNRRATQHPDFIRL